MQHYVTLFDALFLPQGLALYLSMQRHLENYTLWVLCMDEESHAVLFRLGLPNMRLLRLEELETVALKAVRHTRTRAEYCWTLTPFAPRFVFEADPSVQQTTYLDADVWFRKNPVLIFEEFTASGGQVLITDHAYAPEHDQTAISAQYCVQFLTFRRYGSEPVRQWWEERCLEWCHARYEDGKFGDQKYLDDWPERFPGLVHVLAHKEWALAPWNVTRFPYGSAIFYHFHGLRILSEEQVYPGAYPLPQGVVDQVYKPYLADLKGAFGLLRQAGLIPQPQKRPRGFFQVLYAQLKSISGNSPAARLRRSMKIV